LNMNENSFHTNEWDFSKKDEGQSTFFG